MVPIHLIDDINTSILVLAVGMVMAKLQNVNTMMRCVMHCVGPPPSLKVISVLVNETASRNFLRHS